jgi:hypothetical protein
LYPGTEGVATKREEKAMENCKLLPIESVKKVKEKTN